MVQLSIAGEEGVGEGVGVRSTLVPQLSICYYKTTQRSSVVSEVPALI